MLLFVMSEKISFVVCLRQRQRRQRILAPTKKVKKSRRKKNNERGGREGTRNVFLSLFDYFLVAFLCVSSPHSRRRESFFK